MKIFLFTALGLLVFVGLPLFVAKIMDDGIDEEEIWDE